MSAKLAYLSRTPSAKTLRSYVGEDVDDDIENLDTLDEPFLTEPRVGSPEENGVNCDHHDSNGYADDECSSSSESSDTLTDHPSRSSSPDYETDLEDEPAKEPRIEDLTGTALYEALCQKLGIVPLSCVKTNINRTHFRLAHRGLGPKGVEALAPPIGMSPDARYLNLENNMIGPEGGTFVSTMVTTNGMITDLNLSYNALGTVGIASLCRAIRDNETLLNLDLSTEYRQAIMIITRIITLVNIIAKLYPKWAIFRVLDNNFEDKDAHMFADIIENNIKIVALNLSKNHFSIAGGKILGQSIANNDTLENLDLSWNAIRLEGAMAFAKGLAGNLGLKKLNLSMNGFATEGTRSLGIALTLNKYLEHLDLSYNRISNVAAFDFARYFKINVTLKTLKLHGNPIMYDGAQEILKTISENERSSIYHLDLTGLMVHQEFVDIATQLNAERPFKAEYGIVSQGKNIEGTVDRFADKNPLEILLIFMGEQNLRLVDLFRSFDKDQSGGLTRDEFILGLQEIKTPLSRSQLDELLDMLDKDGDGEIDLKEILNINREYKDIKMKANRYVQEEKLQKKLEKEGKKETELGAFTKEALALKQRAATTMAVAVDAFGAGASNEVRPVTEGGVPLVGNHLDKPEQAAAGPDEVKEDKTSFKVTQEEATELNAQVKTIKTKGVLSMWKNKALV